MNKYSNYSLIEVEVVFRENYNFIKASDLSNFLYYFKVIYSWLAISEESQGIKNNYPLKEIVNNAKSIIQAKLQKKSKTEKSLKRNYYNYNLFKRSLKEKELFITRINKESPLTIWFMGVSTVLVAALILSGGEIEINMNPPKIKIKMNSLGDGIAKLKDAIKK